MPVINDNYEEKIENPRNASKGDFLLAFIALCGVLIGFGIHFILGAALLVLLVILLMIDISPIDVDKENKN